MDAEGLVCRAPPLPPGATVTSLEVGVRRQRGDRERHQERQPGDAADLPGQPPGDGVHARAEDVADDEQQQRAWAPSPASGRVRDR